MDEFHKKELVDAQLATERRFARQFVYAAVIVLVYVAIMIRNYVRTRYDIYDAEIPARFWFNITCVPVMLGYMSYLFFRLYRRWTRRVRHDIEQRLEGKE